MAHRTFRHSSINFFRPSLNCVEICDERGSTLILGERETWYLRKGYLNQIYIDLILLYILLFKKLAKTRMNGVRDRERGLFLQWENEKCSLSEKGMFKSYFYSFTFVIQIFVQETCKN